MPLLLEADTTAAGVLAATLPPGSRVVASVAEVEIWLTGDGGPALVIGPTAPLALALSLAERARTAHPATTVVLLRYELAPDVYAPAMQSGVGAVVAADDQPALGTALARARQVWEAVHGAPGAGDRDGRVITVFSPKGGVGKTTLAVNMGLALTAGGHRVCVVDLDLSFGDVAITLQLIPTHTIADAVGSEANLDFSLLDRLLTPHSSGLSILAAPMSPEGRDRIPASLVSSVVRTLRQQFDFVVVDTPPGFDDQVLGALDETDECIVLATLDVPTIKNTRVALETLDLLHLVRDARHLVVNRADDEVGLSVADVANILSSKVVASLPSSLAVASATNHGEPIVLSKPDHPFARGVVALAADVAGVTLTQPGAVGRTSRFGRSKKQRQESR